jgi:hypothetical protein
MQQHHRGTVARTADIDVQVGVRHRGVEAGAEGTAKKIVRETILSG